jgi:hypothetical protein
MQKRNTHVFMILGVASLDARVSSVLIDGHWAWPPAWLDLLVEI